MLNKDVSKYYVTFEVADLEGWHWTKKTARFQTLKDAQRFIDNHLNNDYYRNLKLHTDGLDQAKAEIEFLKRKIRKLEMAIEIAESYNDGE